MADPKIVGPDIVFSTCGLSTFQADFAGLLTAAEVKELRWLVSRSGGQFEPAGSTGPVLSLELPPAPQGYSWRLKVVSAVKQLEAELLLTVIGMTTEPYVQLTAPIAESDIAEVTLPKSKAVRYMAPTSAEGGVFEVGRRTHYKRTKPATDNIGLKSAEPGQGPRFDGRALAPRSDIGHWAMILQASTVAEGGQSFVAANTYDNARMTFGLLQFTPHVPNAQLVLLLRTWLAREDADLYFPMLKLQEVGGKRLIHDRAGKLLEDEHSNEALQRVLNPDLSRIDGAEKQVLASLIYLARTDARTCLDQVKLGVSNFKGYLHGLKGLGIDGRPDYVCALVCDIRNQGRSGPMTVSQCLRLDQAGKAEHDKVYRALLSIKGRLDDKEKVYEFASRVRHVDAAIQDMRASGELGKLKYDEATGGFVPIEIK